MTKTTERERDAIQQKIISVQDQLIKNLERQLFIAEYGGRVPYSPMLGV